MASNESDRIPDAPEPLPEEVEALTNRMDQEYDRMESKPYGGSGAARKRYARECVARLVLVERTQMLNDERNRLIGKVEALESDRAARIAKVEEAANLAEDECFKLYEEGFYTDDMVRPEINKAISAIVAAAKGDA